MPRVRAHLFALVSHPAAVAGTESPLFAACWTCSFYPLRIFEAWRGASLPALCFGHMG